MASSTHIHSLQVCLLAVCCVRSHGNVNLLHAAQARAASGGTTKKAAGDEPWLGHGLKRAPGVAKEVFEVMRDMIRRVSAMLCRSTT